MIKGIWFSLLTPFNLALLAVAFAGNTFSQELPATDIWLVQIENGVPGKPVKINNGHGYNNQPHFSPPAKISP